MVEKQHPLKSHDQSGGLEILDFLKRGLKFHQEGNLSQASILYKKALAIEPDMFDALYLLSIATAQSGDAKTALTLIDRAIKIRPNETSTHSTRGNILKQLGRLDEALASYDRSIAIRGNDPNTFYNRGLILRELGRLEKALQSYNRSLELQPMNPDALCNRGNVLTDLGRLDDALQDFNKAISLQPNHFESLNSRGSLLVKQKRPAEAIETFKMALGLRPDNHFILGDVRHAQMKICEWEGFADDVLSLTRGITNNKPVTYPFSLLGLVDSTELQKTANQIYFDQLSKHRQAIISTKKNIPNGKIRIGYFSANFHNHAVAYLINGMLAKHDRSKFEVIGFVFGPKKDDQMRKTISRNFDRFIDVGNLNDLEIVGISHKLKIDIAVDLMGYTENSHPKIFLNRAAPIQVNYLGYPSTMGADTLDYIIGDKTVIPEDQAKHYAEKVVFMPNCYQVNDDGRKISNRQFSREELGLPNQGFVFCNFNKFYKILPATFDSWMRILDGVEGSVLWLLKDNAEGAKNLRKEAERRNIDSNRIIFAERFQLDHHLSRHQLADLFIDTLPYNAHTTASDALWAGLPILTLVGESFSSRVCASLLNSVGLQDLITTSEGAYESKAIDLANNPERLNLFRKKLEKNRVSKPLFNTQLYTKHLEAAYSEMYRRNQSGLPLDHIQVADLETISP